MKASAVAVSGRDPVSGRMIWYDLIRRAWHRYTAGIRRVRSLCHAELLLFWRNRTSVFSALAMPIVLVGAVSGVKIDRGALSTTAFLVTSLLGFVLLSAVFYNLVTTYVARREESVLKRLRAGEIADTEILAGLASPAVVVALGQIVLFMLTGASLLGLPLPVNAPVLVLGVVGGVTVFVLLAAVCSILTRTVETAQITTLPILFACMIGSGIGGPVTMLHGPLAIVLRLLPLTPVTELMRLGWLGTTGQAAPQTFTGVLDDTAVPVAILAGWVVLCAHVVRRRFRWEPRQ